MAYQVQESTCEEEQIKFEWGTTDNGILSHMPVVNIEINENLNGFLNSSQVVQFVQTKVENNSLQTDRLLPLNEQTRCVRQKENTVYNGDVHQNLESIDVDYWHDKNDTVHLSTTKETFSIMKLPSVIVKGSQNCRIDPSFDLDSKVISNQFIPNHSHESFNVSDQGEIISQGIQLEESNNTTSLLPLLDRNQDSIIDPVSKINNKKTKDFITPDMSTCDDSSDKISSVQINEGNCAFVNDDSGEMNIGSDITQKELKDVKHIESVVSDGLKEIDHDIVVNETMNTPANRDVPPMSGKENKSINYDLKIDSSNTPNHPISFTPCSYHHSDPSNYENPQEIINANQIENFIDNNESHKSPLQPLENSLGTLIRVDCQNLSEDLCEKDSNISSEYTSQNSIDSDPTTDTASINNNLNLDEEISGHNCLLNPTYVQVLAEIKQKDQTISELDETVKRLKEVLSEETSKSQRISELEQLLSQHEKELLLIKREQEIDKQGFTLIKKELENKCAIFKKDIEMANRDKENMVMRYAVSEKELINAKKEKENLMKKLKDTVKENESLSDRIKHLVSDKSKLSQLLDTKTNDLSAAHKEIDKLKEEINARDIKIKWTQNKLKTEMEAHKEYPSQIDRLMIRIRCLEEDLNNAKIESQNLKKQLEESEQNKVLESQLKEEQAKLIMEKYEHSEIETKYKSLQTKYQSMIEENNSLSFQVQHLETERLQLEKKLSSSREDTEKLSNTVSELQSKLVELDSLNSQLKQSEDKIDTLMSEMERVRHQNEELLQDMSACRARESEMLSFTQKLTTKNVQLQSEFSTLESKAASLEKKDEKSRIELKELKEKLNEVQSELMKEKAKREEETHLLARQIAEKTKRSEAFEVDLADTKANLTQSKLKHATVVKELQRELSFLRRKLESLEASGHVSSANSVSESPYAQACDVSKEILVERILKLQSEAAKSAEKIEFLEDHAAQLLAEVQKQSRLLQSYMLREEAGALAPSFLDNHKAEVSRHGGIMASLYSSTQQDEGMSLELSLEINRKLQAVLEDTLLKNIMLKENLDTLGDEIVRLKEKK